MQTYVYLLVFLHIADGCKFSDNKKISIKASSGESAVLPCYCPDLRMPSEFIWRFRKAGMVDFNRIYPVDETDRYKDRIQPLSAGAPGNLTICITHLTAEDEGMYQCVDKNQSFKSRSFILIVNGNVTMSIPNLTVEDGGVCEGQDKKQSSSQESFPFIPIAVGTAIILQIVVLVYCTTQKKMLVGLSTAQPMEMEV